MTCRVVPGCLNFPGSGIVKDLKVYVCGWTDRPVALDPSRALEEGICNTFSTGVREERGWGRPQPGEALEFLTFGINAPKGLYPQT